MSRTTRKEQKAFAAAVEQAEREALRAACNLDDNVMFSYVMRLHGVTVAQDGMILIPRSTYAEIPDDYRGIDRAGGRRMWLVPGKNGSTLIFEGLHFTTTA